MSRAKETKANGSVLVVGAGIAGMQSALDLAESGYLVHLVTDEPSIGGKMAQLDKTFPTNDCAMCLMGPKMTDCQNHPNIDLYTMTTLAGVEGEAGNFKVKLRAQPRYVDVEECTACGECEAVCPVRARDEFNEGLGERRAIYKQFPQAVPNAYLIEKRGTPPCRQTCPAGCNAQGYAAMIGEGKFGDALEVIERRIPFPGICGRICHHPCESECNRGEIDEPLSIAALKRAAADYGWEEFVENHPPTPVPEGERREERVAVIGGGPAGLTAAFDLVRRGYRVTVYDALPAPGGLLIGGIPRYRLPREIVERETQYLLAHGIEFVGNTRVGEDISFEEIRSKHAAVVLAVGLPRGRSLPLPGAEAEGIVEGLAFLREAALGGRPPVGEKVLIIGGGNAAMDAARTALRLGAAEVHVACVEARHEMLAHEWEIEEALEEGVKLHPAWGPQEYIVEGEKVVGVRMQRCLSVFDAEGRFNPQYEPGSDRVFEADMVILCIGQASELGFLEGSGVETSRGLIAVDELTLATSEDGIFACGDITGRGASVVEAIAGGHEAAESVARYLEGRDLREGRAKEKGEKLPPPETTPRHPAGRHSVRMADPAERARDFREVSLGFDRETAVEEAKRCVHCGICSECLQCEQACEKNALRHQDAEREIELEVGSIILAPGYSLFDAELAGEYGYGLYRNVLTSIEFERLLSSSGPTKGEVVRPSDGAHPRRIAFIQCVGSRDVSCDAEYCSSICCMYSTKEAVIAKEHDPDIEPTIFYLDVRSYGKKFDLYVQSARENYGVRYVRSMISSVKEDPRTANLIIRYYTDGELREEEFDMVVLAVGVRPPTGAEDLARAAGIELNEYGFARTDPYDPTRTTREGVFVAGAFQRPQDIPDTVMNASAAAARASSLLAEVRGDMVREKSYPEERDVSGEEVRVGVFVCRCGINIASVVDVPAVVEYARGLPGVVHAEESVYTCSQDSLKKIRTRIQEHNLNRVVVASCTIRTHQPLFREALREAGLNQFLFEMANIRDQCSWVHRDYPDLATEKAKDLVKMAVSKVREHRPLHLSPVPVVQKALVIGGGVAGMTAALEVAEQGYEAFLVDRERELGGMLRRLRFPVEGQAPPELLESLLARVDANPRVHVYTEARIEDFSGHVGHFQTTISLPHGEGGPRKLVQLDHGVVIVATGAPEFRPDGHYLYGEDPRVLTGTELEEAVARGDARVSEATSVAMIQCVGSRDEERNYCSRTCCTQSVKNALELKRRRPDMDVFVFYRDMRTYGFNERLYREAREAGVLFIQFADEDRPRVEAREDGLYVAARDLLSGREVTVRADILALAAGAVAPEGTAELASALKVPVDENGFLLETHIKLGPMDFPSQGIFLCGSGHSPKFISEAIYQAQGAVARAAQFLSRDQLMVGGVVSVVDPDKCAACLTCVRACPYSVPFINDDGVAEIEAVQCQGCGICASECPAKAIQLQHYTDQQVREKVRGLFAEVI